ncbi:MAG: crosslink repair DNA glycosylase YcaQ family protein, partial [Anaerolineae bacterium]|nr:crosslink repair DNA glycosylase YcaQ family protein [Anaerolineae bacterium]
MKLTTQEARYLRLHAQGLAGPRLRTVSAVVERLVGVQAQEEAAARLAIRPRSTGLTAAGVEQARVDERTIVHTWAMRGTLHLVSAAELGWLLPLLGPHFVRGGRRRRKQLGIDGKIGRTAMRAIRELLGAEGALTRAELTTRLAARGIPTDGQAIYHLIGRAALEGILCAGAPRDSERTYALLDQWAPVTSTGEGEEQVARLAHRYLQGYGPVTVEDFAHWSGLPLR